MKGRNQRYVYSLLIGILVMAAITIHHRPEPVEKSAYLMGTLVRVKAWGASAGRAVPEALEKLKRLEGLFSRCLAGSDVSRINRAGTDGVSVSEETVELVGEALHFSQLSSGAFDPTVGPLVRLWSIGTEEARIPEENEIRCARRLVDWRRVKLVGERRVSIGRGSLVDLGGIAKGYAADALRASLLRAGVDSGLVDLGGNILVFGSSPKGSRWHIGVQDPLKPRGRVMGVVELAEGAVVTSGIYERFFEKGGKRYHHILDPATGRPARSGLLAVTVVSVEALDGDALSTALFVMGVDLGMELVKRLEDVEALFVTDEGRVILSPGLAGNFSLRAEGYSLETW